MDGEGSTGVAKGGKAPCFQISQVDRRSLSRFAKIVGQGTVGGPYQGKNKKSRPYYKLHYARFSSVAKILTLLWPWLGHDKREQAIKTFDTIQQNFFHPRSL